MGTSITSKNVALIFAIIAIIGAASAHYGQYGWQPYGGHGGGYGGHGGGYGGGYHRPRYQMQYRPPQQQPTQSNYRNPSPNIQVQEAAWVCKNPAGDMIILTEDTNPAPPSGNDGKNANQGDFNNANQGNYNNENFYHYNPFIKPDPPNYPVPNTNVHEPTTKKPVWIDLPDFSNLPSTYHPVAPPKTTTTEKPNEYGEGLIDARSL